jgi:hypothetical protein
VIAGGGDPLAVAARLALPSPETRLSTMCHVIADFVNSTTNIATDPTTPEPRTDRRLRVFGEPPINLIP